MLNQSDAKTFWKKKVVLHNIDITTMCSLTKCKQFCLTEHYLYH